CHISITPPTMVVLARRPTTDSPIRSVTLATTNTMAAASTSASGRSSGSAGLVASVSPQRGHHALPPTGGSGSRSSRSHSGHATISTLSPLDPALPLERAAELFGDLVRRLLGRALDRR